MVKKKRFTGLSRLRLFLFLSLLVCTIVILGYNCVLNVIKIYSISVQKNNLESKMVVLKDTEEMLNADVMRLSDPVYLARYAREKYLYSKDGELILRIDEKNY